MLQYPGDRHSIKTLSAVFLILSFASYLAWYFRHFRLFLTFSQPERISDGKFCKVILTFDSVEDFLRWEHSMKTSLTVCSHGTIYLVWSSSFRICGSLFQAPRWSGPPNWESANRKIKREEPPPFRASFTYASSPQSESLEQAKSVDELLRCYHSNETSALALSYSTICFQYFTKQNLKFLSFFDLDYFWQWNGK